MKNQTIKTIQLFLGLLIISCGGNKDADGGGEEVVLDPTKATLVYPTNNEECTGGTEVSATEAKLNFDWEKADNTTSYTLYIRNLDTDTTTEYTASTDDLEVTLERAVPYSWYVTSKSTKTSATATSDTWKFYLAGAGVENYAPFPADLISPQDEATISTQTVNLEWIGSDVDNDIKEYEVYLDTNATPTTKVATTTTQKLEQQAVVAGSMYYWKVVTLDLSGNSATSQTYSFSTD